MSTEENPFTGTLFLGQPVQKIMERMYLKAAEVHYKQVRASAERLLGPKALTQIPGMTKPWEEMTDDERRAIIARVEHIVDITVLEFLEIQDEIAKAATEAQTEGESK